MSFFRKLYPTYGMPDFPVSLIGNFGSTNINNHPLLEDEGFMSGEMQKQCQDALLSNFDMDRPLSFLLKNRKNRDQIAFTVIMALSAPCERHVELLAYCLPFFQDDHGQLELEGVCARKLQWLLNLAPLNAGKVLKLHGDDPTFYTLTKPIALSYCLAATIFDDTDLASYLLAHEAALMRAKLKLFPHNKDFIKGLLQDTPYNPESGVRRLIEQNQRMSNVETHKRICRFLEVSKGFSRTNEGFYDPDASIRAQYNTKDGAQPIVLEENLEGSEHLDAILSLPNIDSFLRNFSLNVLQEFFVSSPTDPDVRHSEQGQLIYRLTQEALKAGNPAKNIHYTTLYKIDPYRLQDRAESGEDLDKTWVRAVLSLHSGGHLNEAARMVVKALLESEGLEKILAYGLADEHLLAARDITYDSSYLNGASAVARSQALTKDLGL